MARKPVPNAILKLRGSRWTRPSGSEPKYQAPIGSVVPACLSGIALEKWNELYPVLTASGVLKSTDLGDFMRYCLLWLVWDSLRVRALSKKPGRSIGSFLRVDTQLLRYAEQFGLTPSSRAKVLTGKLSEPVKSKFHRTG